MVRSHVSTTTQRTPHFTQAGVAQTHTVEENEKKNVKRRREREREARQNESEIQKKANLKLRII